MKIVTIKKLLILTVLSAVFGVLGLFAQAGNEPKLAATGANKPGQQVNSQTTAPKPVLSATSTNSDKSKAKQPRTKAEPRLAATGSNNNAPEVKKK